MKMEKRQFRIGELAEYIGVERFVIRFWEKEFGIKSYRSHGGQRFYKETDVKTFQEIKKLLYEKGFTIAGAKQQITRGSPDQFQASEKINLGQSTQKDMPLSSIALNELKVIRQQLIKLKELL